MAQVKANLLLVLLAGALAPLASAQPRLTLVASGFSSPLLVTAPAGDPARLFVVEQRGRIRIVKGSSVTGTFLDLSSRVSCCGERGLLGLAFHPRYFENGRFYVNYTDGSGNTVVSEWRVSASPDVADASSERVLLRQNQPFANHNGGNLAFSPRDGMLTIGLGDGGSGGDPQNNAQSDGTWLGKLLRIDVDTQGDGRAYGIPPDNPFAGSPTPRAEQWAKGVRNPWRFTFDRRTYDFVLGDVGQGSREEIDFAAGSSAGGENYGWRLMEGFACFNPASGCQSLPLTLPVYEYTHSNGRCSVTGGPVVRSAALPELEGRYLFADYCTGEVFSMRVGPGAASGLRDHTAEIAPVSGRLNNVSSFGEDASGNVYLCDIFDGEVYRLDSRSGSAQKLVPVVVDVAGRFGSRFSTALALANPGAAAATFTLSYTAAAGSGTVEQTVPGGGQLLIADVADFLRGKGLPLAEESAGSLRIASAGLTSAGRLPVAVRTTTPSGAGRAGVSYGARRTAALFGDEALVFGLRESGAERSNLAIVNAGPDALRLRLSFTPEQGGPAVDWPEVIALAPGEWRQLDSPLAALGLAGGTAVVVRDSGTGPFDAYAVVNDNVTNDGSFLPAVRRLRPREEVIVPVLVETPRFTSELVLHNPGDTGVTARLQYVESLAGTGAAAEAVVAEVAEIELPPHAQRIVASAFDLFRAQGAAVGARGGSYAGALRVSFSSGGRRAAGLAAVRVSAPEANGGAYGVFLPGVPFSETSFEPVDLPGLTHGGTTRSNVAVVHAGGSPEAITLRLEVLDASGAAAGELTRTLGPLGWLQEDGLLGRFGLNEGRVRVTRVAGNGRFLAYSVVNDGGTPETGTNDGSALLGE